MIIQTNTSALFLQNSLKSSQNNINKSVERLSSGLRINSAKDDSAGLAISNRMTASINGMEQAIRNVNDGISMLNTAEGGIYEINNSLQRIRELTVKYKNGTNSEDDIASIYSEIDQNLAEIDRVSNDASFNNIDLLNSKAGTIIIQAGATEDQHIDLHFGEISTKKLGIDGFSVRGFDVPATTSSQLKSYRGSNVVETFTVIGSTSSTTPGATPESTLKNNIGLSSGSITINPESHLDNDGKWYARVTISGISQADISKFENDGDPSNDHITNGDFYVGFSGYADLSDPVNEKFYLSVDNIFPGNLIPASPKNPLKTIDAAMSKVSDLQSEIGANQNRLESAINNLQTTDYNLQSARSRIMDADYAVEASKMIHSQILQQAGTALLSQATRVPQNILSLLK